MTDHNETNPDNTENRKRVFVTHARVLADDERQSLSEKEKAYEETCENRGMWLELFCPDDACFTEAERVGLPVFCEDPKTKKSLWLDLFCPDDSCEVVQPATLP